MRACIQAHTVTGKTVSKYFSGILRCTLILPRDNTPDIENASRSIDRVVSKAHWASPERNPTRYTTCPYMLMYWPYIYSPYVPAKSAVLHTREPEYTQTNTRICIRVSAYISVLASGIHKGWWCSSESPLRAGRGQGPPIRGRGENLTERPNRTE